MDWVFLAQTQHCLQMKNQTILDLGSKIIYKRNHKEKIMIMKEKKTKSNILKQHLQ